MDQLKDRIAIAPPLCAAADPVNLPATVPPIAAPAASSPPVPIAEGDALCEPDDGDPPRGHYAAPAPVRRALSK